VGIEVEAGALEEVEPEHAASPSPPSPAAAAVLRNPRRFVRLPIAWYHRSSFDAESFVHEPRCPTFCGPTVGALAVTNRLRAENKKARRSFEPGLFYLKMVWR
jgi:hypothetical protein